jgi:hypothetical protein
MSVRKQVRWAAIGTALLVSSAFVQPASAGLQWQPNPRVPAAFTTGSLAMWHQTTIYPQPGTPISIGEALNTIRAEVDAAIASGEITDSALIASLYSTLDFWQAIRRRDQQRIR